MARRFFLVASDLQPELNRLKLRSSMSSFAAALQQLLLGDAAMQILAPPNEEVQRALELLQNDWNGFQAYLTDHIDSVNQDDSIAIATVAEQNLQVLSRSEQLMQLLSEASHRAGASTKGLLVDIATRQKTLILRFSKEVLLMPSPAPGQFWEKWRISLRRHRRPSSLAWTVWDCLSWIRCAQCDR